MNKIIFDKIKCVAPLPSKKDFDGSVVQYRDSQALSALYAEIYTEIQRHYSYDCDECDKHRNSNESRKRIKDKVLKKVPQLALFLKNIHPGAAHQVGALSTLRAEQVDFNNISDFKRELRSRHENRWTRIFREKKGNDEAQGCVSVLGAVSEELLSQAIKTVSQSNEIFQTTQDDTKSYGDFVLMSLPNNLWFSVKSGYSRERLLASGFSNDLVGVGFFESSKEFTSLSKIRNLKKAGFLAIYLPDVAVNQEQYDNETNTFNEVEDYYIKDGGAAPLNINGTLFFRALSTLGHDIEALLKIRLQKRSTIAF